MNSAPKAEMQSVNARCVRLLEKVADATSLAPMIESHALSRGANDLLIEVKAAAVNPSDVKAATGLMPYAVFPRTPGRDYAGVVIDGPADWIGREVFGSSGDLGIRRDGSHATHRCLTLEHDTGRRERHLAAHRRLAFGRKYDRAWRQDLSQYCSLSPRSP